MKRIRGSGRGGHTYIDIESDLSDETLGSGKTTKRKSTRRETAGGRRPRGGIKRITIPEDEIINEADAVNVNGGGAIAGKVGGFGLGALLTAVPAVINGVSTIAQMVGRGHKKRKHHSKRKHSSKRHRSEKDGGKFIPQVSEEPKKVKNMMSDKNMVLCLFKCNPKSAEKMQDETHCIDPNHVVQMLKKLIEMNSKTMNYILLHEGDDELVYKLPLEFVDSVGESAKLFNFNMQVGNQGQKI